MNVLERMLKGMRYDKLPAHIQEAVQLYIEHGVMPGSFLSAVICNDLKESFGRADDINRARLFNIVSFFYSQAPTVCWGSAKAMDEWHKTGGMRGWIEKGKKEEKDRKDPK